MHLSGITYEGMVELIREKHEINKKRKWGSPDENGVVRHLK